jgi:hypothetical protein
MKATAILAFSFDGKERASEEYSLVLTLSKGHLSM